MKRTTLFALVIAAVALVGCGGSAKPNTPNPGSPLDPQGNWIFTFTGQTGQVELQFAGQLFELAPPVVTANEMGTAPFGFTCGGMTPHGQASGTDSITLTVDQTDTHNPPFTLTGTIAADQAHMSGTWTAPGNACAPSPNGTWAAQLLTNVDGTWTGTAGNGAGISAALTENTDQTSPNMGTVTGTITVTNSTCIAPAALTLAADGNFHLGEGLTLKSTPDANGVSVASGSGTVDTAATHATGLAFVFSGGACDGQQFTVDLLKQ